MNFHQRNRFSANLLNSAAQKYNRNVQQHKSLGDLEGSDSSVYGSFSGFGADAGSCFSLDICPDLVLAMVAAAAAAAAFLIYNAITVAGRRKKRSGTLNDDDSFLSSVFYPISNFITLGRVVLL